MIVWWDRFWQDIASTSDQILRELSGSAWGLDALDAAKQTLGWGEEGGNNRGSEIETLRRGGPTGPWCAAACSYWIEEGWAINKGAEGWAALHVEERRGCPVRRSHGARKLWRRIGKAGRFVDSPLPGDFALWSRPGASWSGHIGIVETVAGDGFVTIEGNKGQYNRRTGHGSKVRRYTHEMGERELIGFARLP